jgi:hypothetical protein
MPRAWQLLTKRLPKSKLVHVFFAKELICMFVEVEGERVWVDSCPGRLRLSNSCVATVRALDPSLHPQLQGHPFDWLCAIPQLRPDSDQTAEGTII